MLLISWSEGKVVDVGVVSGGPGAASGGAAGRRRGGGDSGSTTEGALVDQVHALADAGIDGLICNFAAYSHTSIALHDALKSTGLPAIEVHISDIKKREPFRHHSMTAGACIDMISGQGFPGYLEALRRLAAL